MNLFVSRIPVLVVVILLAYSSDCLFEDKVDEVCSKSPNRPFCEQFLRSDPRAANATLWELGTIAIRLAVEPVGDLKQRLVGLNGTTPDAELRKRYQVCIGYADDSINDLNLTGQFLFKKDYFDTFTFAVRIYGKVGQCDKQFAKPPAEPAELKQATIRVRDIALIIAAIAKTLYNGAVA